jgi:hypothetical protein
MATYRELYELGSNSDLRNVVQVAVTMKAHAIMQEASPSPSRLEWAKGALGSGAPEAAELLRYVLAANSTATKSQILAASDASVQATVDAAVDKLYP